MTQGVGLSVGATNMAAVMPGYAAATRQSVLTLYRHRRPEVGVPSENPRLGERGLVVTGFVDRAGDPVGIVAADGSFHRGEVLIADALRALCFTVTGGRAPVSPPAVTFPAHWRVAAVDALRRELAALPEWSSGPTPLTLISDAAAALTALQAEPGLPNRGVVALCDFGGTGTTLTLADAENGYRPIGAAVRHTGPLAAFIEALHEHLFRNGIHPADLAAIGAVGGGANIPMVGTTLSEQLRVPVITTRHPELAAARGAAMRAVRRCRQKSLPAVVPVPAIAARPRVHFVPEEPARAERTAQSWYRPLLVTAALFAAMVLVGTGAVMALRDDAAAMPGTTTTTESVDLPK
jgi:hypothetical protein